MAVRDIMVACNSKRRGTNLDAQDFVQDGVTIHGTRYFSLTYQIKTTNLNCGWRDGAPFCWMPEAWDDVPDFAPGYRSYDPAVQGCEDAQHPGKHYCCTQGGGWECHTSCWGAHLGYCNIR